MITILLDEIPDEALYGALYEIPVSHEIMAYWQGHCVYYRSTHKGCPCEYRGVDAPWAVDFAIKAKAKLAQPR
jgi:hypothetical protein